MKVYVGGSATNVCAACIAGCIGEAKAFLWGSPDVRDECEFDYTRLRVSRERRHDALAKGLPIGLVKNSAALRAMGFWIDGDPACVSCGLYTMDGAFPLCPDCEQCADCGHAEDCGHDPR